MSTFWGAAVRKKRWGNAVCLSRESCVGGSKRFGLARCIFRLLLLGEWRREGLINQEIYGQERKKEDTVFPPTFNFFGEQQLVPIAFTLFTV